MSIQIYWFVVVIVAFLLVIGAWWHIYRRYRKAKHLLQDMGKELAEKTKAIERLTSVDIIDNLAPPTGNSLIVAFDPNGLITYVNDHAESFFGYTQEELIGHTLDTTLLPTPDRVHANEPSLPQKIITNPKLYINIDMQNRRKDNTPVWVSWTYRLMYDQNNAVKEIRAVGFDISKRKLCEQKLQHMTSTDLLTGVLKRTAFMTQAEQEVRRALRYERPLSLLLIKMNYLRLLGQDKDFETGERALKQVIAACKASLREMDVIGRIDDVEFAVLLPETPVADLPVVEERLYLKLQEMSDKQKILFSQTSLQNKEDTIDAMLQRAEQTLSVHTNNQRK